eukprot:1317484-Amphidinium_carterae.1
MEPLLSHRAASGQRGTPEIVGIIPPGAQLAACAVYHVSEGKNAPKGIVHKGFVHKNGNFKNSKNA